MKKTILLSLLLFTGYAFSQVGINATISPLYRIQYHDGSELQLPFRLADISVRYGYGDLELKISADMQVRWQDMKSIDPGLREAYLHYYPDFGEVRIGRQILAWGYADQNNPTDNINPYNYYYLFETGIERKEAADAAALTVNMAGSSIDIVISRHQANIFPYDESDFPFSIPPEADPRGRTEDPEQPWETGLRCRFSLMNSDLSLSWWQGYDKQATPALLLLSQESLQPPIQFSYRHTSVYGANLVTFISDFTLRTEFAYFQTENLAETSDAFDLILPLKAEYMQYILQLEYTTSSDILLSTQYMGHHINRARGFSRSTLLPALMESIQSGTGSAFTVPVGDISNEFQSALGSPLNNFLEAALSVSASRLFLDNRLDIRSAVIINLEAPGQIYSFSADYYLNYFLEINAYTSFIHAGDTDSFFAQMEDFSHAGIGLSLNLSY